jgi:hypothetical protein
MRRPSPLSSVCYLNLSMTHHIHDVQEMRLRNNNDKGSWVDQYDLSAGAWRDSGGCPDFRWRGSYPDGQKVRSALPAPGAD